MATVYEVAAHISGRLGGIGRFKLHKLVYYVQAWSLVWRARPAFTGRIEAWTNGPVEPSLQATLVHGNSAPIRSANALSEEDGAHVDRVLVYYGHMSSDALINLTHQEAPWRDARSGLLPTAKSSVEIAHQAMVEYYGKLWRESQEDNAALREPAAFTGSVDDFEKFIDGG